MCDTITQKNANVVVTSKLEALWNNDDKKISSNLINCLSALGMPISNAIATNKVLRCLTSNQKPKVAVIKEDNDLTTLNLITLIGKFEKHEQELTCLDKHEKKREKKKKNNKDMEMEERTNPKALKASSSRSSNCKHVYDCDFSDGENLNCHYGCKIP